MTTVFLSYRRENEEHLKRVRDLADRLEKAGVTVVLDQIAQDREFNGGGPDEGWPHWSAAQAKNPNHTILIIASTGWFRAYEKTEVPGVALGAAAEAGVIEQRLYNNAGVARDIRIVVFAELVGTDVPLDLQRYHRFLDPRDFADLLRWLHGKGPEIQPVEEWPAGPPSLSWVMADHEGVRSALADLLTSQTSFRYLPITGPSESGKSQITKQLLGNALRFPGLLCGRFDFKGTTYVDEELQRFVQYLELSVPLVSSGTVGQRLGFILSDLVTRKRPTLLIFDTFEAAGSAEQWVREILLLTLIRSPWLRVVIAGQRVPQGGGAPWDNETRQAIELTAPAPEHWLIFARAFKPEISLQFVQQLHQLSGGRPSLLVQLLGPAF